MHQAFKDLYIYFFLILQKENKQNIAPRFVNIVFLIFQKGNKQKNASRFVNILFLIFQKENKQKILPGLFLGFVSIPF